MEEPVGPRATVVRALGEGTWWVALGRLALVRAGLLAVLVILSGVLAVSVFPLLGGVLDNLADAGPPDVTTLLLVIGVAALPLMLGVAANTLARALQLDVLAAGRLTVVDLAVSRGQQAAARRAEDLTQWWLRECVPQAVNLLGMRVEALTAFGYLATWHWGIALALLAANILNGWAFQRWMQAELSEHDLDANARRDLLHAAVRGNPGELLHYRAYGFVASRYAHHAVRAIAAASRVRRRAALWLVFSNGVLGVVIFAALALAIHQVTTGVAGLGILAFVFPTLFALEGAGPAGDAGVAVARSHNILQDIAFRKRLSPTPEQARGADTAAAGIRIDGVTLRAGDTDILSGVDLSIAPGSLVALVGENGSGKTTLLRLLAGTLMPTTGTLSVPEPAAMVMQDPPRYPLPLDQQSLDHKVDLEQELAALGLTGVDPVAGLSGGQWQRLALVRALAHARRGTRVLLLDEPVAALDPAVEDTFIRHLHDLRATHPELIVVLSTHRPEILQHADQVVVMDGGRVATVGTQEEVRHHLSIIAQRKEQP